MSEQDNRKGALIMIAVTAIFAAQDGISRHLAESYNTYMVVMIRFWFFAVFAIWMSSRTKGGLARAIRAHHPYLQLFRSALLVLEIYVMIAAFVALGLIETHAIFIAYPLLVAALSGPVLGEKVGWRRWTAIGIGFIGVLVILKPGFGVFSPASILAVTAALMFSLYALLTRKVADKDSSATSMFWTGTVGAVISTLVGMWFWQPMVGGDWVWMAILCLTAVAGHGLMIKAYEIAEASAVQPFSYMQLVFGAFVGMTFFGDILRPNVAVGAVIVVGAGLFTLWRQRQRKVKVVPRPAIRP
ncbi:RhaT family transporter [Thioclava sp. SK-1]|uniref:DMT family transporter n=1 Tax=Thioclava sp. SK-1 TaxID=1889770 RepID=UPI0008244463|nr:DMT family transporter [Thioclava sp. SK-1]OCX66517.1 RhaT family transporter [Thioclava sp. SK-1]